MAEAEALLPARGSVFAFPWLTVKSVKFHGAGR